MSNAYRNRNPQGLTEASAMILAFCIDYFIEHDRLPSYRVIGEAFGYGDTGASWHFYGLALLGYFEKVGAHYRFARDWEGRPRSVLAQEYKALTAEKAESEAA